MDTPNNQDGFGVCGMHEHEKMMKEDPEKFRQHLKEEHGGNDPHDHSATNIV